MDRPKDNIKRSQRNIRTTFSRNQREKIAQLFSLLLLSESMEEVEEGLEPLDRDYLNLKRDENALLKRAEAIEAISDITTEAIILALRLLV